MAWKNWPNYFFDTILNGLNISKKLNNSVILQSSLWFHLYILLRPFCSLVELSILGNPPQQPLRHWKFSSCKWVWEPRSGVHRGGDRGTVDRPVERPGSHLSWCADNRCETSPPFCGSLLGATTGLFVLIFGPALCYCFWTSANLCRLSTSRTLGVGRGSPYQNLGQACSINLVSVCSSYLRINCF